MTEVGSGQPVTEFEQVNIKDLSEEELFTSLLEAGSDWTDDERDRVVRAYNLVRFAHRDDEHRDQPYMYHLLRNANRITQYLHITEPDIIVGILLHDVVEDHPDDVIRYGMATDTGLAIPTDPEEKQLLAFDSIARNFSVRSSRMVQGMTNPPTNRSQFDSRKDWLDAYLDHVAEEIRNPDVFFGKWADWVDNGLGIIHSSEDLAEERLEGFKEKYGLVMPILEARFYHIDIQSMLDDVAKENIKRTFELAHERLHVPADPRPLGGMAING